jgi:hypothetical protein
MSIAVGATPVLAEAPPTAEEVAELKATLQSMQETMQEMQRELQALKAQQRAPGAPAQAAVGADRGAPTERMAALEESTQALEESQDSILKRLDTMTDVSVYTSVEFLNFEDRDALFDARHVELLVDAAPYDRLRGRTQIRFERLASIDDDDESHQGDIEVHQGWLEYNINEYFNPRIGVVLVPFGKYNLEHFEPYQEFTIRPLSHLRVVPSTWSDVAAGFTGTAPLGELTKLAMASDLQADYQLFVTQGLSADIRDHRGLRDARASYKTDNNNNKAFVGRLGLRPTPNSEFGISGYQGEYDAVGHAIAGFDVDGKVRFGPFDLLGEYALFDLHEGGFRFDGGTNPQSVTTGIVPESIRGGFLEAHYRFWFDALNNTFLGRKFANPTFTAMARFDQVRIDDDSDAGSGPNNEQRWVIGLNYRPVPTWVFKLEYVVWNNVKTETLDSTTTGGQDGFIASVAAAF